MQQVIRARELVRAFDTLGLPQPEQTMLRLSFSSADLPSTHRWVPVQSPNIVALWAVVRDGTSKSYTRMSLGWHRRPLSPVVFRYRCMPAAVGSGSWPACFFPTWPRRKFLSLIERPFDQRHRYGAPQDFRQPIPRPVPTFTAGQTPRAPSTQCLLSAGERVLTRPLTVALVGNPENWLMDTYGEWARAKFCGSTHVRRCRALPPCTQPATCPDCAPSPTPSCRRGKSCFGGFFTVQRFAVFYIRTTGSASMRQQREVIWFVGSCAATTKAVESHGRRGRKRRQSCSMHDRGGLNTSSPEFREFVSDVDKTTRVFRSSKVCRALMCELHSGGLPGTGFRRRNSDVPFTVWGGHGSW